MDDNVRGIANPYCSSCSKGVNKSCCLAEVKSKVNVWTFFPLADTTLLIHNNFGSVSYLFVLSTNHPKSLCPARHKYLNLILYIM